MIHIKKNSNFLIDSTSRVSGLGDATSGDARKRHF
jgi:hypothetical protein